jgi:hypothetical protein
MRLLPEIVKFVRVRCGDGEYSTDVTALRGCGCNGVRPARLDDFTARQQIDDYLHTVEPAVNMRRRVVVRKADEPYAVERL